MKQKHNGGFSLVEVLVAMAILAACVVPACSALVLSHRMNAKADELMRAELAVSSAVETLMAEGIEKDSDAYDIVTVDGTSTEIDRFPDVTVKTETGKQGETEVSYYYIVYVASNDESVSVTTCIRAKGGSQ